jgi:hypothetical protein
MKIEKVYPAGWKVTTDDETYYFGEYGQFGCYCNDGVVYKDRHAFETGEGVCYVNEYGFENDENRGKLFIFDAIASEIENNSYIAISGYTRQNLIDLCDGNEVMAEDLFDHLDWMAPETLWDEWCEDDEEQENLEENE